MAQKLAVSSITRRGNWVTDAPVGPAGWSLSAVVAEWTRGGSSLTPRERGGTPRGESRPQRCDQGATSVDSRRRADLHGQLDDVHAELMQAGGYYASLANEYFRTRTLDPALETASPALSACVPDGEQAA